MNDQTEVNDESSAEGQSRLNDGLGLVARIEKHLRQLAPHMMNREGVLLLRKAKEEIARLQEESNRLHINATHWSAEARRYQRLYDCASICGA